MFYSKKAFFIVKDMFQSQSDNHQFEEDVETL